MSNRRTATSGAGRLLLPLLGACLWAAVVGYKPVIIVHGLFDSSGDFKNLQRFINEVSARDEQEVCVYVCVFVLGQILWRDCVLQCVDIRHTLQALQLLSTCYQTCTLQCVFCPCINTLYHCAWVSRLFVMSSNAFSLNCRDTQF